MPAASILPLSRKKLLVEPEGPVSSAEGSKAPPAGLTTPTFSATYRLLSSIEDTPVSGGCGMNWEGAGTVHENCVVFFKVNEEWGGLSNMSNDFPLRVNGLRIGSSEAL